MTLNSTKKTARITGVLFLIVTITHILGTSIIENLVYTPDYLTSIAANKPMWITALLIMFVCCAGIIGIAIAVFPILRKYHLGVALSYLGFRMVESILFIITEIKTSSLLTLSEQYNKSDITLKPIFETIGATLQESRTWSFEIGMLFFCTAAFMFYFAFYKSKLLPRFLSIWGIVGAILAFVATLFRFYEIEIPGLGIVLNLPIATNEIFLSFWLIFKGFNLTPNTSNNSA